MRQAMHVLKARGDRRGLTEITDSVRSWVSKQGIAAGMLTLFCRHTSASLLIQENAARAVCVFRRSRAAVPIQAGPAFRSMPG